MSDESQQALVERFNGLSMAIELMNQRMDSFVEQISGAKRLAYGNAQKLLDEMVCKVDKQLSKLSSLENVNPKLQDLEFRLKDIVKTLSDNSDSLESLNKTIATQIRIDDIYQQRLEKIEVYLSKYNLDAILQEIDCIEKEYETKLSKAVRKIAKKK